MAKIPLRSASARLKSPSSSSYSRSRPKSSLSPSSRPSRDRHSRTGRSPSASPSPARRPAGLLRPDSYRRSRSHESHDRRRTSPTASPKRKSRRDEHDDREDLRKQRKYRNSLSPPSPRIAEPPLETPDGRHSSSREQWWGGSRPGRDGPPAAGESSSSRRRRLSVDPPASPPYASGGGSDRGDGRHSPSNLRVSSPPTGHIHSQQRPSTPLKYRPSKSDDRHHHGHDSPDRRDTHRRTDDSRYGSKHSPSPHRHHSHGEVDEVEGEAKSFLDKIPGAAAAYGGVRMLSKHADNAKEWADWLTNLNQTPGEIQSLSARVTTTRDTMMQIQAMMKARPDLFEGKAGEALHDQIQDTVDETDDTLRDMTKVLEELSQNGSSAAGGADAQDGRGSATWKGLQEYWSSYRYKNEYEEKVKELDGELERHMGTLSTLMVNIYSRSLMKPTPAILEESSPSPSPSPHPKAAGSTTEASQTVEDSPPTPTINVTSPPSITAASIDRPISPKTMPASPPTVQSPDAVPPAVPTAVPTAAAPKPVPSPPKPSVSFAEPPRPASVVDAHAEPTHVSTPTSPRFSRDAKKRAGRSESSDDEDQKGRKGSPPLSPPSPNTLGKEEDTFAVPPTTSSPRPKSPPQPSQSGHTAPHSTASDPVPVIPPGPSDRRASSPQGSTASQEDEKSDPRRINTSTPDPEETSEDMLLDAAWEGDMDAAARALRHASVNTKDAHGLTALHLACERDNLAVAIMLLDRGARVHLRAEGGRMPLHLAARFASASMVEMLLERAKADPNATTKDARTPLHYAASSAENGDEERREVLRVLRDFGASPVARDSKGETARDVAEKRGYWDAAATLKRSEKKWQADHPQGWLQKHGLMK